MSPTDDKTDQAIGRIVRLSFKNPVVVGLIGVCIGGPVGNYVGTKNQDPRLDSIMVAMREIKPRLESIQPLQDTVKVHGEEIAEIKADHARLAYLAPRKKETGRRWER
jgi:hypothetical protein